MKPSIPQWLGILALALSGSVMAGPAEEVAEIAAPRMRALQEGNVEGYTAAFAENAAFHSAFSAFRLDGKPAIRSYFAEVFQMYPRRLVQQRQSTTRVYNDDLVITNSYSIVYLTDRQGKASAHPVRSSVVWARVDGRWQIVDQHSSPLPVAP